LLGTGGDTLNIRSTNSTTLTTVDTGAGTAANTINVGSLAAGSGGIVDTIAGKLVVIGSGLSDTLHLDDSGDTTPNTVRLTANRITGLGLGGDDESKGVEYDNIETLDIEYGTGGSIFNVRGTTATTNIIGLDTDDYIFVSSDANVTAAMVAAGFDFLTGNLDGIRGTLNIDGRGGRNLLFISDEGATSGDSNVLITDRKLAGADPGLDPDRELTITGLAPAPISYRASHGGNFARGITIWAGSGDDTITIDGTLERTELDADGDPIRVITTLNTGLGNDRVTVTLTEGQDGFFVLNTQGPDNNHPTAPDRDRSTPRSRPCRW
ncbi:MAG TPA: hypothetical protein VF590_07430, partial [Isosphaeraceae bacterium]